VEADGLRLALGERLADGLTLALGESEADGETVADTEAEGESEDAVEVTGRIATAAIDHVAKAPTAVHDIVTEPAGVLGPSVDIPPAPRVPETIAREVWPAPTPIVVSSVATTSTTHELS